MGGFTNIYAQQNGVKNFEKTNSSEMKTFVGGIHLLMGVYGLPRARMYWQQKSRINVIADHMWKNRFFELRSNFHVINNDCVPQNCNDKFHKVRPLYDRIVNRCNSLEVKRNLSVDEQMVLFKGHHQLKYYMRGKPTPWGFKIYMLCGASGLIYNLILYQGGNTELEENYKQQYGFGGAIVIKLVDGILKPRSQYLYFDNLFTSYNLIHALDKKRYLRYRNSAYKPFFKTSFI